MKTYAHRVIHAKSRDFKEAGSSVDCMSWRLVMEVEIESLHRNHTWNLVSLHTNKQAISFKLIFKINNGGIDGVTVTWNTKQDWSQSIIIIHSAKTKNLVIYFYMLWDTYIISLAFVAHYDMGLCSLLSKPHVCLHILKRRHTST